MGTTSNGSMGGSAGICLYSAGISGTIEGPVQYWYTSTHTSTTVSAVGGLCLFFYPFGKGLIHVALRSKPPGVCAVCSM